MITVTTPVTTTTQRSSERRMASSVAGIASAHHTARQEHEEVDVEPGEEQKPDGQPRERERSARHLAHDALQRRILDRLRRLPFRHDFITRKRGLLEKASMRGSST